MKSGADDVITGGANAMLYHGFPHVYREGLAPGLDRYPEPGWYPFALFGSPLTGFTAHLNEHNPYWKIIPELNAYVSRLQWLAREGVRDPQILVLQPDLRQINESAPLYPESKMLLELTAAGYDADYVNTSSLDEARAIGGRLAAPSGSRYELLAVPGTETIRFETALQLARLYSRGVPVVFVGQKPREEAGYLGYRIKSVFIRILLAFIPEIEDGVLVGFAHGQVQPAVDVAGAPLRFLRKRIGSTHFYFLQNLSTELLQTTVRVAGRGPVAKWDV
jgi:alpha-L-rhamnosidase